MSPELEAVLAAARELAWHSHANMYGPPYAARRQAFAQLRGALHVYDQAEGMLRPTRPGADSTIDRRRVIDHPEHGPAVTGRSKRGA